MPDAWAVLQVFPVLLGTLLAADTGAVRHLTRLVAQLRQHLRAWLPDIVRIIHLLWPPPAPAGADTNPLLGDLLDLAACLAGTASEMKQEGLTGDAGSVGLSCVKWMAALLRLVLGCASGTYGLEV